MTNFVLNGGVRASIEVIEHWSTHPDSYGQGAAAISISRAVTAALWRPGGYTFFVQTGAVEGSGGLIWATGTASGGAARRSEGGSATSRYHAMMAGPLSCRLRAAAALHATY